MDEFIQTLHAIIQYATENVDEFDEEELAQIAQFVQRSLAFIAQQETRQQTRAPETPQQPLQGVQYPSSNINAFQYDPKTKKLLVKFMGKDVAGAGPTYSYDNVPSFIVDVFKRGAVGPKTSGSNRWHTWKKDVTPSHGAAMNALIKMGGFSYQRVA